MKKSNNQGYRLPKYKPSLTGGDGLPKVDESLTRFPLLPLNFRQRTDVLTSPFAKDILNANPQNNEQAVVSLLQGDAGNSGPVQDNKPTMSELLPNDLTQYFNKNLQNIEPTKYEPPKDRYPELANYVRGLLSPVEKLKGNISNFTENPIANTIGAATNVASTLFSPISVGFNIASDIAKLVPGGKELAGSVDKVFEMLSNAPKAGAKLLDKAGVPNNEEVANTISALYPDLFPTGVKKKTLDEISNNLNDANSLASTLLGLSIIGKAGGKFKDKIKGVPPERILSESMALGEKALSKIDKAKLPKIDIKNQNINLEKMLRDESQQTLDNRKPRESYITEDQTPKNISDKLVKRLKTTTISADPRSRLLMNQVEKQVNNALKVKVPFDEKVIVNLINEIRDPKEQKRLENLYTKVLDHNRQLPKAETQIAKPELQKPIKNKITQEENVTELTKPKKAISKMETTTKPIETPIPIEKVPSTKPVEKQGNVAAINRMLNEGKQPRKIAKELGIGVRDVLVEKNKPFEKILDLRDIYNESKGGQKLKSRKPILEEARRLRGQGHNISFGDGRVTLDGKVLKRITKPEPKADLTEIKIKPEASKRFEDLPKDVQQKQEILATDFVQPEDMPQGHGKVTYEKGVEDIKKDNGKEQSPEAKIVRQAGEDILENGFDAKTGGRRYPVSPEEVKADIEQKIEKKPEDTSFNFGANKKDVRVKSKLKFTELSQNEQAKISGLNDRLKNHKDFQKLKSIVDPKGDFIDSPSLYLSFDSPKAKIIQDKIAKDLNVGFSQGTFKGRGLIIPEPKNKVNDFKLTPKEEKITKKPNEQISFENLAQAKFPEKGITGKGKGEETTPLFNQSKENKNQIDAFKENRTITKDAYLKAKENLRKNLGKLSSGIDPTILKDYATIGAYHFESGIRTFAEWSKKMIEDVGERVKPHLNELFDKINTQRDDKVRGLAQSTEAKAIVKGIVDEIKGLPTYEIKSNKPQIDVVADIVSKDVGRAIRIAMGEEPPPKDILPGFFYSGVKNYAIQTGNGKLLKDLATSEELAKQGTEAGQFIQALKDNDPNSPIKAIKEIVQARQESRHAERASIISQKYEKQIKELEGKLTALENGSIERQIKKIQKQGEFEKRNTGRVRAKEVLKKERNDLYSQLYKATSSLNTGIPLNSAAAKAIKGLVKNYVESGVISAEGIVDNIYQVVKDKIDGIEKSDIRKAILGTSQRKTRTELQKNVSDVRRQLQIINKIEIIKSGGKLPKREITKTKPSESLERLKQQLKNELKDSGISKEQNLDRTKKALRTRLLNLSEKIKNGDYSKEEKISITDKEKESLQTELKRLRGQYNNIQKNLNEVLTDKEAQTIAELSKDATEKLNIMKNSTRRELGAKATPQESAYGKAGEKFNAYVDGLKEKATEIKFRDFLESPLGLSMKALGHIPGMTKSLKATFDNSGLLNQNMLTLMTHPIIWQRNAIKSFVDIYRTIGGKNVLAEIYADKISRPNYPNYLKDEVALGTTEEAFPDSKILEKTPILGRVHKAADVAFTGLAYRNRMDIYDVLAEAAKNGGHADPTGLGLGKIVNSLTGRGDLGALGISESAGNIINVLMFAPRFLKSHIDVLTLHALDKDISPFARKQAAMNLVKIIGSISAITVVANAIRPGTVETDPRSTDFMKIKIGNTRFNFTGGLSSVVILASRLAPLLAGLDGKTKNSKGELVSLNSGKFGSRTGFDVLVGFMRGKASPVMSFAINRLRGQTFSGGRLTLQNQLLNLVEPLPITNYRELAYDPKSANILAAMIADGLGVFTNTYSNDPNVRRIKGYILRADKGGLKGSAVDSFHKAVSQAFANGSITLPQANAYIKQFRELQGKTLKNKSNFDFY